MFVDRKDRTKSRCLIEESTHGGTFRNTGKKGFCGQWWVTEMVSPGLKRTDTETTTCSVNLNVGYMEEYEFKCPQRKEQHVCFNDIIQFSFSKTRFTASRGLGLILTTSETENTENEAFPTLECVLLETFTIVLPPADSAAEYVFAPPRTLNEQT